MRKFFEDFVVGKPGKAPPSRYPGRILFVMAFARSGGQHAAEQTPQFSVVHHPLSEEELRDVLMP